VTERQIYHRIQTPSQTTETALLQIQSQEIWGKPTRGTMWSDIPKVKAYLHELPLSIDRETQKIGIEFRTTIEPDRNTSNNKPGSVVYWSGDREGVRNEDDYAKIKVRITYCNQVDPVYIADD
jgi:hypothetical protein